MLDWWRELRAVWTGKEPLLSAKQVENLQRYGVKDIAGFDAAHPVRELTPLEARGSALGAILFLTGNYPFEVVLPMKPTRLKDEKESMAEWWGISSPEEALAQLEQLEQLVRQGHRQRLTQQLKRQPLDWYARFEANPFIGQRPVGSLAAWDYARLVNVARWSFDFNYLTWEQAWHYIDQANRLARRDFDSWEAFATSFIAGRIMWNPDSSTHDTIAAIATSLLSSPFSAWRTLAWESYPGA
ncbi:MAG: DUF1266 domain-containing protein [Cytophagaceae bacterium]|nr:MAG: DUF1266 domain-containing protein [Cytophagaceae bacterium]